MSLWDARQLIESKIPLDLFVWFFLGAVSFLFGRMIYEAWRDK